MLKDWILTTGLNHTSAIAQTLKSNEVWESRLNNAVRFGKDLQTSTFSLFH